MPEPATLADVDELCRREMLEDSSFKQKGWMCKLGAWYDFIRGCDEWAKHVAARRYHMLVISENSMGAGQSQANNAKKAAEELAKSIAEEEASAATGSGAVEDNHEKADDRAPHKQQMRDLRSLGEHDEVSAMPVAQLNVCNMRIILAAGRVLWSEQTYLAVKKGHRAKGRIMAQSVRHRFRDALVETVVA